MCSIYVCVCVCVVVQARVLWDRMLMHTSCLQQEKTSERECNCFGASLSDSHKIKGAGISKHLLASLGDSQKLRYAGASIAN